MVQLDFERSSPVGSLTADDKSHDVITVPPVQETMMGKMGLET